MYFLTQTVGTRYLGRYIYMQQQWNPLLPTGKDLRAVGAVI